MFQYIAKQQYVGDGIFDGSLTFGTAVINIIYYSQYMNQYLFVLLCTMGLISAVRSSHNYATASCPRATVYTKREFLWPLLLTWFNFNPSMDK